MKPNIKKLLILNAPYLLFVYLFDKVGQAVRLSPGAGLSGKLLSIGSGFSAAFSNALPSFAPMDLLIGIVGAVVIRLAVYVKGKNAKKYRKGMEYGSARWGNAEDIKPYIDPMFENNVLLTQTERLMMSSRPKHPKYARNKRYFISFKDGQGKSHELEVSEQFFMEFRQMERRNRNLLQWDERHREFSEVWDETLNRRALKLPKSIEEQMIEAERAELLCKAVDGLPEIQRRRFLLYYEYEFNFYQIAAMEHCTASAIQKSVAIAKEKVKAEMRKYLQP